MRHIAKDGVAWSVCVSVCMLVTFVSPAKSAKLIEMPYGADSGGPKEPCIRWGSRSFQVKGQFLRIVRPTEKHLESLLWCTQQKGSFNRQ